MCDIEIKTRQLTIRPTVREDVPLMFPHIKENFELTQYMCWEPPSKIEETYAIFDNYKKDPSGEPYRFSILKGQTFIGRVGVRDINREEKSANFGFWIAQDFQNQGYGTEVLKAIARFVFEDLNLEKLTGEVFTENKTSQRVFEKVGFTKVRTIKNALKKRGKLIDEYAYELLAKDFLP